VTERGIPSYNSLADRYCPHTHTTKFSTHFKDVRRNEEMERRRRLAENNRRARLVHSHRLERLNSTQGDQPYAADMVLGSDFGPGASAAESQLMQRSAPQMHAGQPLGVDQVAAHQQKSGPTSSISRCVHSVACFSCVVLCVLCVLCVLVWFGFIIIIFGADLFPSVLCLFVPHHSTPPLARRHHRVTPATLSLAHAGLTAE
jgi:hypothetical protein